MKNRLLRRIACLVLFAPVVGGCAVPTIAGCSTDKLAPDMTRAIQANDASALRSAIAELDETVRLRATDSLAEFWGCLASEKVLPITVLSPRVQVAIGDFLSQAVRNRRISADLSTFQVLAARQAREASSITEQLEAVHLLGTSDASTEIPYLENLANENGPNLALQSESIQALGNICSPQASEALQRLRDNDQVRDSQNRALNQAAARRNKLATIWCRPGD